MSDVRHELLRVTKGKIWSNVSEIDWCTGVLSLSVHSTRLLILALRRGRQSQVDCSTGRALQASVCGRFVTLRDTTRPITDRFI